MGKFSLFIGGPRGAQFTRQADGAVEFGKLLVKGTDANEVIETSKQSDEPYAVSLIDEADGLINAAEQYENNKPCKIETLVPGMVLNLKANGAITAGGHVTPSENGEVELYSSTGNKIGTSIGDTTITDGSRGPILIRKISA